MHFLAPPSVLSGTGLLMVHHFLVRLRPLRMNSYLRCHLSVCGQFDTLALYYSVDYLLLEHLFLPIKKIIGVLWFR